MKVSREFPQLKFSPDSFGQPANDSVKDFDDDDTSVSETEDSADSDSDSSDDASDDDTSDSTDTDAADAAGGEDTEDEETEETDDELERPQPKVAGQHPVEFKDIREKYPNFFKDFPQVRNLLFRESKFSEVFNSWEDARDAAEKSESFVFIEGNIDKGQPEPILKMVKEWNESKFKKFSSNFLDSLYKVDQQAFYGAVKPILHEALSSVQQTGRQRGDEELSKAAEKVARALNLTGGPPRSSKEPDDEVKKEREELEAERKAFDESKYNEAVQEASGKADSELAKILDNTLDPHNTLDKFTFRKAKDEILGQVYSLMQQDEPFQAQMKRIWKNAARSNYNRESREHARRVFFNKAKEYLPEIRQKVRAEIKGRRIVKKSAPRIPVGSVAKKADKGGKVDYSKMSDMDILNS